MATKLTLDSGSKTKYVGYNVPGGGGKVYFTPALFNGQPPATIEVSANLVPVPSKRAIDPAKVQAAANLAAERASKAAAKAAELAAKAKAVAPAGK